MCYIILMLFLLLSYFKSTFLISYSFLFVHHSFYDWISKNSHNNRKTKDLTVDWDSRSKNNLIGDHLHFFFYYCIIYCVSWIWTWCFPVLKWLLSPLHSHTIQYLFYDSSGSFRWNRINFGARHHRFFFNFFTVCSLCLYKIFCKGKNFSRLPNGRKIIKFWFFKLKKIIFFVQIQFVPIPFMLQITKNRGKIENFFYFKNLFGIEM
jgi:hypothetical protein